MGACASVPKGMKAEAAAAPVPLPEPAKGESVKAVESTEEVKVEEEKMNDDETKHQQSLGSLLDEGDPKKEENTEKKKNSEEVPLKPNEDEQKKPNEDEQKDKVTTPTIGPGKNQENEISEETKEAKKEN